MQKKIRLLEEKPNWVKNHKKKATKKEASDSEGEEKTTQCATCLETNCISKQGKVYRCKHFYHCGDQCNIFDSDRTETDYEDYMVEPNTIIKSKSDDERSEDSRITSDINSDILERNERIIRERCARKAAQIKQDNSIKGNLKDIPEYKGVGDKGYQEWANQVKLILRLYPWTPALQANMVEARLSGEALSKVQQARKVKEATGKEFLISELLKTLEDNFDTPSLRKALYSQYFKLSQGKIDIRAYVKVKEKLARTLPDLTDEPKKGIFCTRIGTKNSGICRTFRCTNL